MRTRSTTADGEERALDWIVPMCAATGVGLLALLFVTEIVVPMLLGLIRRR